MLSVPFDLAAMISDVDGVGDAASSAGAWLERSWSDPAAFYAALWGATLGARLPRPKSAAHVGYEIYNDTVMTYARDGHVALRWYEADQGLLELPYAVVHAHATLLAGRWASLGARAGDSISIVAAAGSAELLVALCAALRLGLCISLLPTQGLAALQRRLLALAPSHVAADRLYLPLLRELNLSRLPLRAGDGAAAPPPRSHTYGAKEPLLRLYSPMAAPADAVRTLSADDAVLPALRDGVLLLSLRPGDTLAAPGYDPAQHLHALLLTALLCGATFVHLELRDLAARPVLLSTLALRSLGISPALRDLLAQAPPGTIRGVQRWFRDPAEPFLVEPWQRMLARQDMGQLPCSNLHFDDRAGGCALFSPRRRGAVHQEVLPAPGYPEPLLDVNLSGQPALGRIAVFAGNTVLVRTALGFLYGAALQPRRSGRVFPAEEVIDALAGLPFLCGAAVVPADGGDGHRRFVLVVFTGDAPAEQAGAQHMEVRRRILTTLGEPFLPDQIEVVGLYPRKIEGQVDQEWCQNQYLRGMLFRKVRRPLFRLLTALRAATQD